MRRKQILITLGIVALGATSCGNLAESALESAVERGVEAVAEADSDGEDVEFDLDLSEGTAQVQVGDSVGAVGTDLERPDWLDDNFDLPDDLIIVSHAQEADNGVSFIAGVIEDVAVDELIEQQQNEAEDIGYEVVEDWGNEHRFRALHDDGRLIEGQGIGTDGVYQYTLTFFDAGTHNATQATEAANRTEDVGTAIATIGELNVERTGECVLNGDRFNFTSDDGEVTAGGAEVGDDYQVAASVTDYRDLDNAGAWILDQDQKSVERDGDTITIAGPFANMFDPEAPPRPGLMVVDCG